MHKELSAKNFIIKGDKVYITGQRRLPGILLIKANWCGFCQRFMPTFEEIDRDIGSNYLCLSIEDAEISDSLKQALNFDGYPTLKFFDQNGMIIGNYTGERKKKDILDQICNVYHHCVNKH